MKPFEEFEKAHTLYKEGKFPEAAKHFCKIATQLYVKNENSNLGEIAMKLALESYRKVLGEKTLHQIIRGTKENLLTQFFAVIRYIEDHYKENDKEKIKRRISKPVPIKGAEKRFFFDQSTNDVVKIPPNIRHKSTVRCGPYHASILSAQGPRNYMEDNYYVAELPDQKYLFALFDGHGGDQCARFVKNNLKKYLTNFLDTQDDVTCYNSLIEICVLLNESWKEYIYRKSAKFLDYSGTTALISLIIGTNLWVINVGDSRAVLGKGDEAIQLSEDAKPPLEPYHTEIISRGGFVQWNRVDGSLDLARTIGDIEHPSVSARPTIRKYDLTQLDPKQRNILIMATDGLWDVIASDEAVFLYQEEHSIKDLAAHLITMTYEGGSTDNATVMVIDLNP